MRSHAAAPEGRARLRYDPGRLPDVMPELVRLTSGTWLKPRIATRARQLPSGSRFGERRRLVVAIGAANRDPAVFPDPDRIRLDRQGLPHLAYGIGPRSCFRARLAQMTAEVALRTFLRRVPVWRLYGRVDDHWALLAGMFRYLTRCDSAFAPAEVKPSTTAGAGAERGATVDLALAP